MSELHEVAPEPVAYPSGVGIPSNLPKNGNTHPYLTRSISVLSKLQQYSVIPFSGFAIIHIFGVVITPAIFGPETGNDMIGIGREIYQVPFVEYGIFLSAGIHVLSGILLNFTRKYYSYVKYGKAKVKKNIKKENIEKSMKIKSKMEDEEVKDINEGLGGLTSIVGAGSRPSITSRFFGLSPLSFSGYVFLILLSGHVFYERLAPILVDGDSSMIDLSFIAHSLQQTFGKTFTLLNMLVVTATYHMCVGWNRYLRRFTLKQRKVTYQTLIVLAAMGAISLLRIKDLPVFASAAKRFDLYVNYIRWWWFIR